MAAFRGLSSTNWLRLRGISGRILLLIGCSIAATLITCLVGVLQLRAALEKDAFEDQAAVGQSYAGLIHEYIVAATQTLEGLSQQSLISASLNEQSIMEEYNGIPMEGDPLRRSGFANVLAATPRFNALMQITKDGDLYLMEPYERQKAMPTGNLADRDFFQRAVTSGQLSWSNVTLSATTGTPIVYAAMPILDSVGNIKSVLAGEMTLDGLNETAQSVELGSTGAVMLFDTMGVPIIYPDAEKVQAGAPLTEFPLVQYALEGKTGAFAYHNPLTGQAELGTIQIIPATGWIAVVTQSQAEAFATINYQVILFIALGIAGSIVLLVIGYFIARSLVTDMGKVTAAAAALAQGDATHTIDVRRNDEIGEMAESFRQITAYFKDMASAAQAVANGELTAQVQLRSDRDVLGLAISRMMGQLRRMVGEVAESATHVAQISTQVASVSDQTSRLTDEIAATFAQVRSGAEQTSQQAQTTVAAAEQLSRGIETVSLDTAEQVEEVRRTAEVAEQMAAGVDQVASGAASVAASSQQMKETAERGAESVRAAVSGMAEVARVVSQATEAVADLGKLGERIGTVVETIDDIAEQTNLLALNAAIEAARAGEHGRGFAVVADEVRKLAERSQQETRAIAALIQQVQSATRESVKIMEAGLATAAEGQTKADQAGAALAEILSAVEATAQQVVGIAAATQQLSAAAQSVVNSMSHMQEGAERRRATATDIQGFAIEATAAAQSIAAASEENTAAANSVSSSAELIAERMHDLTSQARELAATAEQLTSLVDRFQLAKEEAETPASTDQSPASLRKVA